MIMDAPNNDNIQVYIKEMHGFGVTDVVRTCEPTYNDAILEQAGIHCHEMVFPDGDPPPEEVIRQWMTLVKEVYSNKKGAIAVHCVAGLGRAPVLVAVALIERGMEAMDAIMFIRQNRKGAINQRQLRFLENYKPKHGGTKCKCTIM
uniref:protein-tyrosine-phosphatase n=1 Tax=Chromera velia CCMP2878 TaxID=1169474 RepID=A0A0G4HE86_9ALVE|eukprot:Cvel_26550.t1-p1 / transcript=Cvel_26550.t1 / gene=Cvel_26550 / organism=Chromera_velia_CCMP2878 / gene_product=Probable protein tyrosine phosphatase type IVA A, putative / transcript_product=Probable protein tyrosine phosphatase type IVA A, putative / location=Cvel_scaffold3177:1754-4063(-) / protein_length=146 / sequence_SO=supercontig / SO=protein_coding / is_pseudo=false